VKRILWHENIYELISVNVINTPIDDLKPYAHNPKTHPAEQVENIIGAAC